MEEKKQVLAPPQQADLTKFKLKPKEEIIQIIKDKDKIFVIACSKCFREFGEESQEELNEGTKIIRENGKIIVEAASLDFLCNEALTRKKLATFKNIDQAEAVCVISCGIGAQTVAEVLADKPVKTLADSISIADNATTAFAGKGICLFEDKCAACGQCYLNYTAGICPIIECSKSLINGPCGGAKEGKCEISKERDCAWEKIYDKLSRQNRIEIFAGLPVKVHDFSRPDFEKINAYKTAIQEKRGKNFSGGLYPYENKELTNNLAITIFPEAEMVAILLSQHTGKVCEPLVKVGDKVKYGQKIGDASGEGISAPVHSSVSGQVLAIEEQFHPALKRKVPAVVIKSDGQNTRDEFLKAIDAQGLSKEEMRNIIREKGIVGLGGAMFPTHIKLAPPKAVDTLIINGCECEPFLTADERIMIEQTEKIFSGMQIMAKMLGVKKVYFAIEDNKQQAIARSREYIKQATMEEDVSLMELKAKYPQGAERMLIKTVTSREVPSGGLPFDVGVIVSNVATCAAINDAFKEGLPLVKRVITVSGEGITRPGNYEIKIGTSFKNIIEYCSGRPFNFSSLSLRMGGPMMGIAQEGLDACVIKGTSGLIVTKRPDIEADISRKCIKCGRCVDVCPMELYPLHFVFCAQGDKWQEMCKYNVKDCIECGCCDYICSAKLPISEIAKKAKQICK